MTRWQSFKSILPNSWGELLITACILFGLCSLLLRLHWIVLSIFAGLLFLQLVRIRLREVADVKRGWRTGHWGRDEMYYDEYRDGQWARIMIGGEMLDKKPHHVIYFRMIKFPDWAQGRKDEILQRIKSAFPAPDYEHCED